MTGYNPFDPPFDPASRPESVPGANIFRRPGGSPEISRAAAGGSPFEGTRPPAGKAARASRAPVAKPARPPAEPSDETNADPQPSAESAASAAGASAEQEVVSDADAAANAESPTLKLPASAQMRMVEEILRGANAATTGLTLLQENLRWPGVLRFEPTTGPDGPSVESESSVAVRLTAGEHNFGNLALDSASVSARVLEQLRQCGLWLSAMLAMARQHQTLRRLADTDELSGAFNRRYFTEIVPRLLDKARKERFCVTILLFDIDDFKQYNDQFGHAAGDAIIREVIGLLRHCTRNQDLVARIGGDEFAVVFWDQGILRQPDSQHPRSVLNIAQRFRKAVAEHPWNADGGPIAGRLSISGGLATFPWDASNLDQLMAVADGELLRAKSMGKNAIVLAGPGETPEEET